LILSLTAIVIAIFIVLFVAYYNKKQSKQKMELQAKEVELQQSLLLNSLEVQEAEQKRIARDLHDEVGALLSVTKMSLNVLGRKIKDDTLSKDLLKSKKLLEDSIATVRRISKELIPSSLENFGLVAAIEDFLNQVKQSTGLSVNFETDFLEDDNLTKNQELMLYRIVQELTNNAIKHSGATQLEVSLSHLSAEQVKLIFFDNGSGFNAQEINEKSGGGLGLKNIESRVKVISGKLSIVSNAEIGSRFNIIVPL
ncbi:MAG: histidine kinase, partial [Spirosomataceae bacterium]